MVLDTDHNLPPGTPSIALWDPKVQWELCKMRGFSEHNSNLKDAYMIYIEMVAPYLPADVTLITDTWTMINNSADLRFFGPELEYSKSKGEADTQKSWGKKLNYCFAVHEKLKALPCRVVTLCHEYVDRDDKGKINNFAVPLVSGGFKDQMAGHYTDVWRQVILPHPEDEKKVWYAWQLKPNSMCACKTSFNTDVTYITAHYDKIKELVAKATFV